MAWYTTIVACWWYTSNTAAVIPERQQDQHEHASSWCVEVDILSGWSPRIVYVHGNVSYETRKTHVVTGALYLAALLCRACFDLWMLVLTTPFRVPVDPPRAQRSGERGRRQGVRKEGGGCRRDQGWIDSPRAVLCTAYRGFHRSPTR